MRELASWPSRHFPMEPWFFVFVCISGFNGLTAPYVSHNAKKRQGTSLQWLQLPSVHAASRKMHITVYLKN
jgi:hypothetical protein